MMKSILLTAATAVTLMLSPVNAAAEDPAPASDDPQAFYALGFLMSGNLKAFDLTPAELKLVQEGITDGAAGKEPRVDPNNYRTQLRTISQERSAARAAKEKEAGQAYLAAGKITIDKTGLVRPGLFYPATVPGKVQRLRNITDQV